MQQSVSQAYDDKRCGEGLNGHVKSRTPPQDVPISKIDKQVEVLTRLTFARMTYIHDSTTSIPGNAAFMLSIRVGSLISCKGLSCNEMDPNVNGSASVAEVGRTSVLAAAAHYGTGCNQSNT